MFGHLYFAANRVAGYSGFVVYTRSPLLDATCVWMVPGTFFDDWDNF
jgi:hypothetical protein